MPRPFGKPRPAPEHPQVPLDYQSPSTTRRDLGVLGRRRTAIAVAWLTFRLIYWIILLGLIVLAVLWARRMVGLYNSFMPK